MISEKNGLNWKLYFNRDLKFQSHVETTINLYCEINDLTLLLRFKNICLFAQVCL